METYKKSNFKEIGINDDFNQINHSRSLKNVLRGLHYQKNPKSQSKLIRCISGNILDIVVDIRKESPNYSKWVKIELSDINNKMIYIPQGFAHGFLVLSEVADILYQTDNEYSQKNEAGIKWSDEEININWGIQKNKFIISEKDKNLPRLKEADNNFVYKK